MSNYDLGAYAVALAVNLMIVGAFIASGLALSFRLVQQLSPRLRYVIAVTAFLAATAWPVYAVLRASPEPADGLPVHAVFEGERQTAQTAAPPNQSGERQPFSFEEPDVSNSLKSRPRSAILNQLVARLDAVVHMAAGSGLAAGFFWLWVFVAALLLGREALGYVHLARARRAWRPADARVLGELRWPAAIPLFISEHEGPCTVGLARPVVVIPAGLLGYISSDEARLIARHEIAHARWRDPLVNVLLRVIRALMWPSLPLWFLARSVRVEREAAADHAAVAATRDGDIKNAVVEYAALLVKVARESGKKSKHCQYQLAATQAGEHMHLESRVLRLLRSPARTTRARILLAASALIATAWGVSSLPVTARPVTSISSSNVGEAAAVEESVRAAVEQEARAHHEAGPNVTPAAQAESLPASTDEQSVLNVAGQDTKEAALPHSTNVSGTSPDGAGQALTQTARASEDAVGEDFVNQMAASGYGKLSPEQLAAMRAYGVSPAYVNEMAASGFDKLPADTLINFRWLGIDSAYIRTVAELGYRDLPANTLIDFRLYGVTATYVREMAALGYGNLPARTLVAFRRAGITESYVRQLKERGDEHLTAERLIALRTQQVAVAESGKKE